MIALKISTKLALSFALFCILCIGLGAAGIYGMFMLNADFASVHENRVVPLKYLKVISDSYAVAIVGAANKVRDHTLSPEEGVAALEQAQQQLDNAWSAYRRTRHTVDEDVRIDALHPLLKNAAQVLADLKSKMASRDYGEISDFVTRQLYPATESIGDQLGELVDLQLAEAEKSFNQDQARYRALQYAMIAAVGFGVLFSAVCSVLLIRIIKTRLGGTVAIARRVAQGDLTSDIKIHSRDETGEVLVALRDMNAGLATLVTQIRAASESVSGASSRIAAGNSDLSRRTESQASGLEQTAATMEELTATVKSNATSADEANRIAQETATAALRGGKAVDDVVAAMAQITLSARKIVEIIGVIDGIAFQTNILALNAAVEAAHAGERGRGFAVVASEVRGLAQKSAAAAKEIKALVEDSVAWVAQGSRLVSIAGETIGTTVSEVQRLKQIVADISGASRQQSEGIAQVSETILQMEQVVQQNATVVGEAASAAELLRDQAQRLKTAVETFKLPEEAAAFQTGAIEAPHDLRAHQSPVTEGADDGRRGAQTSRQREKPGRHWIRLAYNKL